MSMHKQNDGPALEEALTTHGLPHDKPNQLADAFRCGWAAYVDDAPMTNPQTDALEPCPCCHGTAELDTMRHVNAPLDQGLISEPAIYCLECGLEITDSYGEGEIDDDQIIQMLVGKWNHRPAEQALKARVAELEAAQEWQYSVAPWLDKCFGNAIAMNTQERNHRFLEEALELVQSAGCTKSEAHQLVEYTFGRPLGVLEQEVGGVMLTLAALCLAQGVDMHHLGEVELARVWTKVEEIRAKQASKPRNSPLPAKPK